MSTNTLMNFEIFEATPGSHLLLQQQNNEVSVAAISQNLFNTASVHKHQLVGKPLGQAYAALFENADIKSWQTAAQQAFQQKKKLSFDFPDEKGSRFSSVVFNPVVNSSGGVDYVIQSFEGVKNKSYDTEVSPKQMAQVYQLLMSAPVAVCLIKGAEQVVELANEAILEIWRKDASVVGKQLLQAMPELKSTVFPDLLRQVRESGKPYHANESHAYFLRNGREELVYFNFVYQPYYEANNSEASGVMVIATEVTELVLARQKVEESELRYRTLINEAAVATAVYVGREMKIQYANDAMIRLWGKDATAIGNTVKNALPELEGQPFHQLLDDVFTTGKTYWGKEDRADLVVDGKLQSFYFNFTYKALRNSEGEIYGILNMAVDVTEQVLAKQQVQENEAMLQQRVQERTLELENKNKELERSNANLEEFAYAASHDMKEPIRKIHFFSDRLQQRLAGRLDDEEQSFFNRMVLATKRMNTLIEDLLTFSQVSLGASQFEHIDLNRKIQLVLEDLELPIQEKKASVVVAKLPVINGHRRQIQQLFQNLVGNALKYTREDVVPEVVITCASIKENEIPIDAVPKNSERQFYAITIKDNGIGFEQRDADRIFQMFTRLHGNAEYKGSGIGLSIVKKIVANHSGYITARGELDKGASFTVYLPADV